MLLTVAGLHVPVIPLSDMPGKVGTAPPLQILNEVPKLNVGVMFGFTVTVNVVVVPHWLGLLGVKVYVPLAVLLIVAGLHVPVMPLSDMPGKVGTAPPLQILNDVPKLNVGVTRGFTVTVNVVVVPH